MTALQKGLLCALQVAIWQLARTTWDDRCREGGPGSEVDWTCRSRRYLALQLEVVCDSAVPHRRTRISARYARPQTFNVELWRKTCVETGLGFDCSSSTEGPICSSLPAWGSSDNELSEPVLFFLLSTQRSVATS